MPGNQTAKLGRVAVGEVTPKDRIGERERYACSANGGGEHRYGGNARH